MWLKAFRLSKKSNIPLYLILHDDWLITENYGAWQESLNKEFENMYKHASERFCISLKMEKHYRSLYGVRGQVLYPFRGKNDIIFPPHQNKKKKHLKYCYAGSLFTGDFISMLNDLSGQIEEQGGELHIFSQGNKNALGEYEHLVKQHVTFHGLLDPAVLMRLMSEEMDVGILVNSFLHEESFMYNFSSKLVDYTSAGLPVLFWGPASSGAISWALSGNYKAVSIKQNSNDIARLVKLFQDNEIRMGLAKELRDLSKTDFSYENNYKLFIDKISSTS
jgi:hypothetical protein